MKRSISAVLLIVLLALVWMSVQAASGRVAATTAKRHHRMRTAHRHKRRHRHPHAHAAGARRIARAAHAACPNADTRPTRTNQRAINAAILCLVNRERARHGLQPLRADWTLGAIANGQAHDMVKGRYFGDNSLSGRTPLQRVKATRRSSGPLVLGQNIAWGSGGLATPRAIVASWMRSPGHRQIMLTRKYHDVGAGVATGVPRRRRVSGAATYVLDLVGTAS